MKRSRATLLAAVALACCTATPAHAADAVLSPAPGAAGLTAYNGHVVWSSRDPVSGRWSLTQLHRGAVSALAVAPRSVPFDADAGSDADGNAVVVYSRCATEPSPPSGLSPGADWMTASGCDIYQTRLDGAGGEIRLDRVNSRDGSETTPSIWRGTVAFARRARGGHVAKLLLRRPSDRTPTRLGGGSIQLCYPGCPGAHPTAGPESLDLTGSNVTYVWRMTGGQTYGVGPVWELRVARTDGMPALHADGGLISGTCGYRMPFAATVTGRTLRYAVAGGECDTSFTHFA
ncbi:MAG: hypothetical protein QOJ85_3621, partial [Solirubrobacteraceae bacterium]|nr:hypothetical protein [Solirubrobacteraceae bacterium]